MNILYLEHGYSEAPPRTGGEHRSRQLLQTLRKVGTVYVFSTVLRKEWERRSDDGRVVWCCIEPWRSPLYILNRLIEFVCNIVRWHPFGVRKSVAKVFPGVEFDAVVCRYAKMAGYARPWKIAPVYVDADDLPIEYFRMALKPQLLSAVGALVDWFVRRWQARIFRHATGVWLANPQDVSAVSDPKCVCLPNVSPQIEDGPCGSDVPRDSILFVGVMSYRPNVEGMRHFLSAVWPEIRSRHPDLRCRIVGRDAPSDFHLCDGVDVLGVVDDLRAEYARCHFAVVPVPCGSGTCVKTLEALAMGRVALCSEFGARGIDASLFGQGVMVARSDDEMLEQAIDLLERPTERVRMEARCASLVNDLYGISTFERIVARTLKECI